MRTNRPNTPKSQEKRASSALTINRISLPIPNLHSAICTLQSEPCNLNPVLCTLIDAIRHDPVAQERGDDEELPVGDQLEICGVQPLFHHVENLDHLSLGRY
jgi:hypothetical protein